MSLIEYNSMKCANEQKKHLIPKKCILNITNKINLNITCIIIIYLILYYY